MLQSDEDKHEFDAILFYKNSPRDWERSLFKPKEAYW
jgi:hypothetical protein